MVSVSVASVMVVSVDLKDSGKTIEVSLSRIKGRDYTQTDEVHTSGTTLTVRVGSVDCDLVGNGFEGLGLVTISIV